MRRGADLDTNTDRRRPGNWSRLLAVAIGVMMLSSACGTEPPETIATSGSGPPDGSATSVPEPAPTGGDNTTPTTEPEAPIQTIPLPNPGDGELAFRTDVEVLEGPIAPDAGVVRHAARLIDTGEVFAVEVTMLEVPEGTAFIEYLVNGRPRVLSSYLPGKVTAMPVATDGQVSITAVALDVDQSEIERSSDETLR